ncbi:MAG: hypothetical protein ABSA11_11285 [Candidatus Bathyarchaeia archaeon]|jgi:hypothetical protein
MTDSFGSVKVLGHVYEEDIVIHTDGNVTKRKKKKSRDLKGIYGGHTPLSERELKFLQKEKPAIVYVGIGYESALPITEDAKAILSEYETVFEPTPSIAQMIDGEKRRFAAVIHVTC